MRMSRIVRNLLSGPWQVHRAFPKAAMRNIEQAVGESERSHCGEVRFAVEAGLPVAELLRGMTARERAVEIFSQLRIWDTEQNNGVLIYLLLADHDVEIVADRGIHARVGTAEWEAICHEMEAEFRRGRFEQGVLHGLSRISALLAQHFPAAAANPNELSDKPVVL